MFLLSGDDLVPMHEQAYDSEDRLQGWLAKYPDLLAGGDQLAGSPRRWLLVKREAGVPDQEAGGSRWSLDHLFIDQEAVPILVEVKRSDDTRIRREVVGQMLDYAANGVVYWPAIRRGRGRPWLDGRPEGQATKIPALQHGPMLGASANRIGDIALDADLAGLFPPCMQRIPELAIDIGTCHQHLGQGRSTPLVGRRILQRCELGRTTGKRNCTIANGAHMAERAAH